MSDIDNDLMTIEPITRLNALLKQIRYSDNHTLLPLPPSGSQRQYYRIKDLNEGGMPDLIGFNNPVREENVAQLHFTEHFLKQGFAVPALLAYDSAMSTFLVEDVGTVSLMDIVTSDPEQAMPYYLEALSQLVRFQTRGINGLDMSVAYPTARYDEETVMWDLNYFKYCLLKPAGIVFNEVLLEADFKELSQRLTAVRSNFFCYRDFQSRNIMIHNDKPWFIDFQGGRYGPPVYDVVSLLHQVKAGLSDTMQSELLEHYLNVLGTVDLSLADEVRENYNLFVYFRLMQVLGAYGFRGLVEGKAHFLQSLIPAVQRLANRRVQWPLLPELPELESCFDALIEQYKPREAQPTTGLTVLISSFSYKKKGPPKDMTGNGGGMVFDCRSLPNPHRIDELRPLTGADQPIRHWMDEKEECRSFLHHSTALIDQAVDNYLARGFNHLQVSFGCTGGRHRSVYCAIKTFEHLKESRPMLTLVIQHLETHVEDTE